MSKNPSDSFNSFDDLDPRQFAKPTDKPAELANEPSRQLLESEGAGTNEVIGTDDRRAGFAEVATQLTDVHRDMQKARNAIPELEARGQAEVAQHTREYLDRLRTEREEILEVMADRVTPIKHKGQWRFIDRSPTEIRRALAGLPGFKEASVQLEKENPEIGQQAGYLLLDELTPLIRDGRLSMPKDFWRRQVLDKPVNNEPEEISTDPAAAASADNHPSSRKLSEIKKAEKIRSARHFDADDRDSDAEWLRHQRPDEAGLARRDHKRRLKFAQAQSLPSQSISGYSIDNSSQQGKNNMISREHRSDDEARVADSDNKLGDELRDELIPDSATPRSPLDG